MVRYNAQNYIHIYIDMSKAFDTLDHSIPLHVSKLNYYEVTSCSYDLLSLLV